MRMGASILSILCDVAVGHDVTLSIKTLEGRYLLTVPTCVPKLAKKALEPSHSNSASCLFGA